MPTIEWNQWVDLEGRHFWATLTGQVLNERTGPSPWRKKYVTARVTSVRRATRKKDDKEAEIVIKPMIATLRDKDCIKLVPEELPPELTKIDPREAMPPPAEGEVTIPSREPWPPPEDQIPF